VSFFVLLLLFRGDSIPCFDPSLEACSVLAFPQEGRSSAVQKLI
jgi:hypothetical protein